MNDDCEFCRTTPNAGETACGNLDQANNCAWFGESDRKAYLRKHDGRMAEIVEIVAIGLCAKNAIEMGGSGHGHWWDLGDDAKGVFRDLASIFLADRSSALIHDDD